LLAKAELVTLAAPNSFITDTAFKLSARLGGSPQDFSPPSLRDLLGISQFAGGTKLLAAIFRWPAIFAEAAGQLGAVPNHPAKPSPPAVISFASPEFRTLLGEAVQRSFPSNEFASLRFSS
jgi:hypothetical protein